ncbi:MAG TPA: RecX family transcriptional regulator [Firmicutes bacterium]|nr:RecX family transcriptional regulator [Bacillota bacterium]
MEQKKTNKARAAGLRLLTARDRSTQEIKDRLERRFCEEDALDAVAYLTELGYLDDRRYAENYVEYRNLSRPRGNYLLRLELRNKGVAESIIEQVLNTEEEECALARRCGLEHLKRSGNADFPTLKRRLYGALQRRGFSPLAVNRAVGELLDSDLEKEYN